MLNAIRSINPIWFYFAAGLVATVLIVTGVETGAIEPIGRFFVAVYQHIAGYFRTVLHAL